MILNKRPTSELLSCSPGYCGTQKIPGVRSTSPAGLACSSPLKSNRVKYKSSTALAARLGRQPNHSANHNTPGPFFIFRHKIINTKGNEIEANFDFVPTTRQRIISI